MEALLLRGFSTVPPVRLFTFPPHRTPSTHERTPLTQAHTPGTTTSMGVGRGVALSMCSVLLLHGQASAPVAAFSVPGVDFRSLIVKGRTAAAAGSRMPRALSSASEPLDDGGKRAINSGDGGTTRVGRARDIAAQARRGAGDPARQTRSRVTMQGTERASTPTLEETQRGGETRRTFLPAALLPPSRLVPSPEEDVTKGRGSGTSSLRATTSPPPRPPPAAAAAAAAATTQTEGDVSEDVDALQRRVREILGAYSNKAPPAEHWPPGRRIRVRGVEMYYKDTGTRGRGETRSARKGRPTFVLVHGLAGSTASWDEVITDLSEYGRVISFDRPGFGKTERVIPPAGLPWRLCPQTLGENPYSADFAAKALFGILDRLGVDKVILIAHSLGAQVALRAVRSRPDMIRALVLVSPAVLNPLDSKFVMGRDPNANLFTPIANLRTRVETTAKLAAFNLQLLQPGEAGLETVRNMTLNGNVEERVQNNFHDRALPSARPELVLKYIEPLKDPLWDRGLLYFYKSLQGEVQPGEQLLQRALDVWRGPSMVITGDDDPTVPTQSSVHVAEAMEASLVVVESCAHIPMDEKSEAFSSAVLRFAKSGEVQDALVAERNTAK